MQDPIDLTEIDIRIKSLRKTAEELQSLGEDFPAIYRNTRRILAGIKMLELNVPEM